MTLTIKRIAKATTPGRYGDGHGLYLQVLSPTNRSWLLRYERNGRERWMGIGPLHTVDLAEARERARKARLLLLDGIDPLDARDADRREKDQNARRASAIPTFREAAQEYFAVHSPKWRNAKHVKQFTSTIKKYAKKLDNLRVNEITNVEVRDVLKPIWSRIPESASRVRGRIENILSWAIANKFREGPNPARWSDNLEHLLPARSQIARPVHHPALPYDQIAEFITKLAQREGSAARALEFTILCAARTGEVTGATWDEIDLKAGVWTVPANRIKGGREHRVPLSDRVLKILRALPTEKGNEFVFVGPRKGGLSNMAMAAVLRRMARDDITVHGFRSTFRDWAAERTAYPNHVVEMALAHVVGNAVEAAYRRGDLFDKRRKLMGDWARYCTTKPVTADNVTPLRRAR